MNSKAWRRGTLTVTVIAALMVALLIVGVVMLVVGRGNSDPEHAVSPTSASNTTTTRPTGTEKSLREVEDEIASRPMLDVGTDWLPQPEAAPVGEALVLPPSTRMVSGLVASGFPRTPQGAVAQLAAMNEAAYRDFDPDTGREVHRLFALPGAVAVTQWDPTQAIADFYVQYPNRNPGKMTASWTPVQGLVKGTADGGDFVVACVLGRLVYAETGDTVQLGAPDCSRMRWSKGRWMLAPGAKPAPAPLTWPRSADSYKAGFRDLGGVAR